jgi:hypothetical protein
VDDQQAVRLGWARLAGLAASTVASVCLTVVLAAGFLLIVTDNPLACFDGDEPACEDKWVGASLGDVSLRSWLLAGAAWLCSGVAFVRLLRLRRHNDLVLVLALSWATLAVAVFLFTRL